MYSKVRYGRLIVNTGNGKGKTTAALLLFETWRNRFHSIGK
jgi:ATP:corrinoid adenosyltransferase